MNGPKETDIRKLTIDERTPRKIIKRNTTIITVAIKKAKIKSVNFSTEFLFFWLLFSMLI